MKSEIFNRLLINLRCRAWLFVFVIFLLTGGTACEKPGNTSVAQIINNENEKIKPQDGAVWIEEEGIRAAWMGYRSCSDEMLDQMVEAKCNVLMLGHEISEFLDMNTTHWQGDKLMVDYNHQCVDSLVNITLSAAKREFGPCLYLPIGWT